MTTKVQACGVFEDVQFESSYVEKIDQLVADFAQQRRRQFLDWFGQFLSFDGSLHTSVRECFYPAIVTMADREARFILNPYFESLSELHDEWTRLTQDLLRHIESAHLDLTWSGVSTQVHFILDSALEHRATWVVHWRKLECAVKFCKSSRERPEVDRAMCGVYVTLSQTIQTITTTSGLNQTLSPN